MGKLSDVTKGALASVYNMKERLETFIEHVLRFGDHVGFLIRAQSASTSSLKEIT